MLNWTIHVTFSTELGSAANARVQLNFRNTIFPKVDCYSSYNMHVIFAELKYGESAHLDLL